MPDISREDLEGPKVDRRTTMKLLSAAGLPALASLAGCTDDSSDPQGGGGGGDGGTSADGSGTEQDDANQGQKMGGSIEAGWLTDVVEHLDPHRVNKGSQIQIQSNIQSGLVKINSDSEIVGDAAEDWSLPDNSTYEFTIREGMTFHNGDPLDAEAIKWSIERLMDFEESEHVGKVKQVESVEADGNTLTISLSEPVAPFLAFLTRGPGRAGTIVNKTAVEEDEEGYNYLPVGSGPFELVEREEGESLTLQKFDDYWMTDDDGNSLPYLDEIHIRLVPEQSTMWSAMQSDSIQFSSQLTGDFANQARDSNQLNTIRSNAGEWNVIALLCQDPAEDPEATRGIGGTEEVSQKWQDQELPTADPKVRRALAMAIDREALAERAHFNWAAPAHTLVNPSIGWAYKESPDWGQHYDPERARELLDEAGYTGDPRFSSEIVALEEDRRELTVIQQQLSEIGVELELNIQQASSYWPATYEYENMMVAYGGASDIDPWMSFYKQLGSYDADLGRGVWQRSLWFNDEFDQLLEESLATPAFDEREGIVDDMARMVAEQAPFITTTFPFNPKVMSSSLKGVEVPAGLSNFHQAYLAE